MDEYPSPPGDAPGAASGVPVDPAAGAQPTPAGARGWFVPVVVALAIGALLVVVGALVVVPYLDAGNAPVTVAGPTDGLGDSTATAQSTVGPSAQPSGAGAELVDPCVVGTWKESSHTEDVPITGYGVVRFTGSNGVVLKYRPDGTGAVDVGAGATVTGTTADGKRIEVGWKGTSTFHFVTSVGSIWYQSLAVKATYVVKINGVTQKTGTGSTTATPDVYACSGDTLRLTGSGPAGTAPGSSYVLVFTRVSQTA